MRGPFRQLLGLAGEGFQLKYTYSRYCSKRPCCRMAACLGRALLWTHSRLVMFVFASHSGTTLARKTLTLVPSCSIVPASMRLLLCPNLFLQEPFIRTMPHSEYPSASSCICEVSKSTALNTSLCRARSSCLPCVCLVPIFTRHTPAPIDSSSPSSALCFTNQLEADAFGTLCFETKLVQS